MTTTAVAPGTPGTGESVTAADREQIVAALRALPGVADADLEPDDTGAGVGLLRLDLVPGVDEVAVAAGVGRILRERFALGVDAERVQLVEDSIEPVPTPDTLPTPELPTLESPAEPGDPGDTDSLEPGPQRIPLVTGDVEVEDVPPATARPGARPAIARMRLVSAGLDITASVTLVHGGRTEVGEATAPATQSGVQRSVASATLRALEQLTYRRVRLDVDHLEVARLGADRTVLVALTLVSPGGSERLTGAAGVREDVRQAVIRAVLDAVNRRLQPYYS